MPTIAYSCTQCPNLNVFLFVPYEKFKQVRNFLCPECGTKQIKIEQYEAGERNTLKELFYKIDSLENRVDYIERQIESNESEEETSN